LALEQNMLKTLSLGAMGLKGRGIEDAIDIAAETGFDAIVFDIFEAERLANERGLPWLKARFADARVVPGNWSLPFQWRNDDAVAAGLEPLARQLALGLELGCGIVATGIPWGLDDLPYEENLPIHVEKMRPVAEVVKAGGGHLGIEFIGPKTLRSQNRYEFVYSLARLREFTAAVGTGNIGAVLDIWHLYTAGESNSDIDDLTPVDVAVVHVNDAPAGIPRDEQQDLARALPLETGVLDIVDFMQRLQRIGFAGPVMPEPFSARLNAIAADDPVAAARELGDSMQRLWDLAELSQR
jgi:sugar phosphate isomerase/epimerase